MEQDQPSVFKDDSSNPGPSSNASDGGEWGIDAIDAAVSVVGAVAGSAFGSAGLIAAALVGPFARHALSRLTELRTRLNEAGFDEQALIRRLDEDEVLAQLVADVARGCVDSSLAAKRVLLARAAIRALNDGAVVDVEARLVRTAASVDTADIRVLAIMGELLDRQDVTATTSVPEIVEQWPGVAEIVESIGAGLEAASLIGVVSGTTRPTGRLLITRYGRLFLDRLIAEGLEEESRRRWSDTQAADPNVKAQDVGGHRGDRA